MSFRRSQKVAGLLKMEISDIIRTRIKDPLVGFITITDVVLSDDLRNAKVYFSVFGDETQLKKTIRGLERARLFIQNELGSRIRLRYTPILQFYPDKSWNYGMTIDRILHDLQLEKDSTAGEN